MPGRKPEPDVGQEARAGCRAANQSSLKSGNREQGREKAGTDKSEHRGGAYGLGRTGGIICG
ncbi:MAG: hypothetical protein HFG58_09095 [Lachnospiraceae bacterium]|nr:hypothetical protein [Lachnospiraceae bacterium]